MEALTTWLRGPQTLRGSVLRVLVPRAAMFLVVAAAVLAGNALSATAATVSLDDAAPAPAPLWSLAERAQQPDCVPLASWPEGKPAAQVVVSGVADGAVTRMSFDRAWAANHNATEADDLWVLAVCP